MADTTGNGQDFSVINSLFGIDPDQLLRARQMATSQAARQEAERAANMDPQKAMVANQLEGGMGVGRAMAPAVQGALGIQQPVDPQMRFARTMQQIVQSLPQAGVDPSDPIAAQQYVGQALMKAGFAQQGMMALENARTQQQAQAKSQADVEHLKAQAVQARNAGDPVMVGMEKAKLTPQSVAEYLAGGRKDLSVLRTTKERTIVKTGDGVYSVDNADPTDKVFLGTPEQHGSAGNDKQAALDRFNTATTPYRGADGNVDWAKFQSTDATAAAQAKLDARVAFGAANLASVVKDPSGLRSQAEAIASGDAPWPSSRANNAAQLIDMVRQINPKATADTFPTTQKTVNAFTSGMEARNTRSFGVLEDHLGTLTGAVTDLKNGNGVLSNALGNKIAEWSGKPAPTNFNAVKEVVADEVVKAVVGTVAAEKDRDAIRATIMNYRSPDQLMGAIDMYRKLAQGQLTGLEKQYKAGTGRDDFNTRIRQVAAPQTATAPSGPDLSAVLAAGRAAKANGPAAYSAWWNGLSPEDQSAISERINAARTKRTQ